MLFEMRGVLRLFLTDVMSVWYCRWWKGFWNGCIILWVGWRCLMVEWLIGVCHIVGICPLKPATH